MDTKTRNTKQEQSDKRKEKRDAILASTIANQTSDSNPIDITTTNGDIASQVSTSISNTSSKPIPLLSLPSSSSTSSCLLSQEVKPKTDKLETGQSEQTQKDLIQEIIYKDVQDILDNDLSCAICQDIYVNPLILNCSHSFCKFCVFTWLSKKRGCPQCRVNVTFQAENLALRNIVNKMILKSPAHVRESRAKLVSQRLNEEQKLESKGLPYILKKQQEREHSINNMTERGIRHSEDILGGVGIRAYFRPPLGPAAPWRWSSDTEESDVSFDVINDQFGIDAEEDSDDDEELDEEISSDEDEDDDEDEDNDDDDEDDDEDDDDDSDPDTDDDMIHEVIDLFDETNDTRDSWNEGSDQPNVVRRSWSDDDHDVEFVFDGDFDTSSSNDSDYTLSRIIEGHSSLESESSNSSSIINIQEVNDSDTEIEESADEAMSHEDNEDQVEEESSEEDTSESENNYDSGSNDDSTVEYEADSWPVEFIEIEDHEMSSDEDFWDNDY